MSGLYNFFYDLFLSVNTSFEEKIETLLSRIFKICDLLEIDNIIFQSENKHYLAQVKVDEKGILITDNFKKIKQTTVLLLSLYKHLKKEVLQNLDKINMLKKFQRSLVKPSPIPKSLTPLHSIPSISLSTSLSLIRHSPF
jgi:hypothetical protein